MTTTATTPAATPFTTGTISTGVETRAATDSIAPARLPGPSAETPARLVDTLLAETSLAKTGNETLNPEARAACAQEPSAATSAEERHEAFRRVEARVSAAEASAEGVAEASVAEATAAVGTGNRGERSYMRQTNLRDFHWANLAKMPAAAILLAACFPGDSIAQQPGQKTFSSPQDASTAFVAAAQSNDEKAMLEILGPDGKQIVSSGDETEDAQSRVNFVRRYREMHRLVKEPEGFTLYVGAENWPLPIPLVNKDRLWYFDTAAGKKEILYRRIGQNEISAIHVCQELVAAEKEYYSTEHEYAQKIFSDEGQHNGLYWKAANGEPQSPIGPLIASAVAEGYAKSQNGAPTPYRGYYFHILTRQGKNSPGGPKNYQAGGKMTEGFAFVASPAEYRSSGVMTFIVNADGVVYQKDLGRKTDSLAKAMQEYNPSSGWQKAEDQQWETAALSITKAK